MLIDLVTCREIVDALQTASGPDRSIDHAVMSAFYVRDSRHIGATSNIGPCGKWVPVKDNVWVDPETDKWVTTAVEGFHFTSSLDDAAQLADRVLPGLRWSLRCVGGLALASAEIDLGHDRICTAGATRAIALVAAVLLVTLSHGVAGPDGRPLAIKNKP